MCIHVVLAGKWCIIKLYIDYLKAGLPMRRYIAWLLVLFSLLACVSVPEIASAETKTKAYQVHIYLGRPVTQEKRYVKGEHTYDRDWVKPDVRGSYALLYRVTEWYNTYFYPVRVLDGIATVYIDLPEGIKFTRAYLDDQMLSTDTPVVIDMTKEAALELADGKIRSRVHMIFTALPMVNIQASETITRDPGASATIQIVDPDYLEHGGDSPLFESEIMIYLRGNSSSRYKEKHPFNFSIMENGSKHDVKLLGLRKDSDWLLDSAYNDASRMRNRTLADIWDEIYQLPWNDSLSGANHGKYVEVILNGRYKGVFVLAEKQDRKQLGLKKTGSGVDSLLIKTDQTLTKPTSPAGFFSMGTEKPGEQEINIWHNVVIKYPKVENVTKDTWTDFYNMTDLVVNGSDKEFSANIGKYIDLDNLALYYVFIESMDITDNMRKNMTFARYSEDYKFIIAPWDMDASLGRYYSSAKARETDRDTNPLFERLIALNVDGFNQKVADVWAKYKDNLLSIDHVIEIMEKYYEVMRMSGAAEREKQLYSHFVSYLDAGYSYYLNFDKELIYIRDYLTRHRKFIEPYFQ